MSFPQTLETTFYVIATENGYWHFDEVGNRHDDWDDVDTAQFFMTSEEAEQFIDEEWDDGFDGPRPEVVKVSKTLKMEKCKA